MGLLLVILVACCLRVIVSEEFSDNRVLVQVIIIRFGSVKNMK